MLVRALAGQDNCPRVGCGARAAWWKANKLLSTGEPSQGMMPVCNFVTTRGARLKLSTRGRPHDTQGSQTEALPDAGVEYAANVELSAGPPKMGYFIQVSQHALLFPSSGRFAGHLFHEPTVDAV